MTGWGQAGPIAQEAGHDINYLALTGALHSLGDADRPPPPPLNLVADLGGGAMYLTVGVLAAVLEARQSGRGQTIDVAMIDGVTHLMSAFQAFRQQGTWTRAARRQYRRRRRAVTIGSYATKDGKYVAVGAIEPHFYANLLAVMGLDPARPARPERSRRVAGDARALRRGLPTRTRDEWVAAAAGRDACLGPVLSIDEAPDHPQMRARDVYARLRWPAAPEPRAALRPHAFRA